MRLNRTWLPLLIGTALAAPAWSEKPEPRIQTGDRIRYRLASAKTKEARVVAIDDAWLRVEDKKQVVFTLDRAQLTALSVQRGRHGHAVGGAMIGLVPGAAFLGYAVSASCDNGANCNSFGAVLVGGALGAVAGAGVGALVRTDRWVDVQPARVRFGIAPMRGGGVSARLSVTF